jgi:hypothetical protein
MNLDLAGPYRRLNKGEVMIVVSNQHNTNDPDNDFVTFEPFMDYLKRKAIQIICKAIGHNEDYYSGVGVCTRCHTNDVYWPEDFKNKFLFPWVLWRLRWSNSKARSYITRLFSVCPDCKKPEWWGKHNDCIPF